MGQTRTGESANRAGFAWSLCSCGAVQYNYKQDSCIRGVLARETALLGTSQSMRERFEKFNSGRTLALTRNRSCIFNCRIG